MNALLTVKSKRLALAAAVHYSRTPTRLVWAAGLLRSAQPTFGRPNTMIQEQRQAVRQRVLKGGKIVFNHGRSAISCTVRNLSEQGALLRVESIVGIPDTFVLVVASGEQPRPCQVVRRTANEVGIKFLIR